MKTSTLIPRRRMRSSINFVQIGFKFILITLLSMNYSSGFAQQKVIDQQEMQQKLTEVNENIQIIDQTIATINTRIFGIAPENVDPSVQARLSNLQIKKDQYTREKISIEAVLTTP